MPPTERGEAAKLTGGVYDDTMSNLSFTDLVIEVRKFIESIERGTRYERGEGFCGIGRK